MQAEELKRAIERAELAESKLKGIEEELQMVGFENFVLFQTFYFAGWREHETA